MKFNFQAHTIYVLKKKTILFVRRYGGHVSEAIETMKQWRNPTGIKLARL